MTNRLFFSMTVALVTYGFTAMGAADLTGKVSYKGAPPKRDPIKMNADSNCVKENAGKKVLKDDVVVNSNGTLANVFVYVKNASGSAPAPTEPVVFDQKGCMYIPKVFGIRVGQTLKIVNSDPTLHNVHALPKSNPSFNQGMPTKNQTIDKKFTKPETGIKIKCDVHGWMAATAHAMDHSFYAVTDDSGNFKITGLPAGEYTVEAIHDKLGTKTATVKVADTGATTEFTYSAVAAN